MYVFRFLGRGGVLGIHTTRSINHTASPLACVRFCGFQVEGLLPKNHTTRPQITRHDRPNVYVFACFVPAGRRAGNHTTRPENHTTATAQVYSFVVFLVELYSWKTTRHAPKPHDLTTRACTFSFFFVSAKGKKSSNVPNFGFRPDRRGKTEAVQRVQRRRGLTDCVWMV